MCESTALFRFNAFTNNFEGNTRYFRVNADPKTLSWGDLDFVKRMIPGETFGRTAEGDYGITYHVYVPTTSEPLHATPIVIAFSPGGDGMQMVNAMKESAEKAGWLLIGVDVLRNSMGDVDIHGMEDEVLDDIYANIRFDWRRVYMAGFSGGASRAYRLTARRPEVIAGVIAYGSWLGFTPDQDYCENMAVAMINGDGDSGANYYVERDTEYLEARNCTVRRFPCHGAGDPVFSASSTQPLPRN